MDTIRFNVALKGRHFFRTDWYGMPEGEAIGAALIDKFPACEGYSVSRAVQTVKMTWEDVTA